MLKVGDLVYEREWQDRISPSWFEHEIISIDVDNRVITTKDHSQKGKIVELRGFETKKELEKQGVKFQEA